MQPLNLLVNLARLQSDDCDVDDACAVTLLVVLLLFATTAPAAAVAAGPRYRSIFLQQLPSHYSDGSRGSSQLQHFRAIRLAALILAL